MTAEQCSTIETLTNSRRDISLIMADVAEKDLQSAIRGIESVVRDLNKLQVDVQLALDGYRRAKALANPKTK